MKAIRKFVDRIKPHFEEGGKLQAFHSVFDGLETFLFVPNHTSRSGVSIHDAIDSKRIMSLVVIALIPTLLFGMYNVGYQNALAAGKLAETAHLDLFIFGFLAVLPKIVVSYAVGLGIEFVVAQWKKEEIQEGFLVSGMLIPLILPVECPLWVIVPATAFAVVFAKEIFGGTGMNIFNVALATRAFLFFSYPTLMSGESVWVAKESILGFGYTLPDAFTAATPLGLASAGQDITTSLYDMVVGFIPGSIGETSVVAILIGAVILLWSGVASWRIMLSVFVGGAATGYLFQALGVSDVTWYEHLFLGGFCFGAVFMATDPVTAPRVESGKYYYGFFIGAIAVLVRVLNPGYPEGMMLAILFMNIFAALIDYCFVERNISMRAKRAKAVTTK